MQTSLDRILLSFTRAGRAGDEDDNNRLQEKKVRIEVIVTGCQVVQRRAACRYY